MADPPPRRFRSPLGLFEAALALVLAAMVLWALKPVPGARAAAAAEKDLLAVLGAVADAEDRLPGRPGAAGFLPLDALAAADPALRAALGDFAPSGVRGVLGNGSYWLTVLLPGEEGVVVAPGEEATTARRGYVAVAWPKAGAPAVLRSLAALPGRALWQRADGMDRRGGAASPPLPRVAFPPPGEGLPKAPLPPPDWVQARSRK